jgi:EAL domain-containing protein (putative c-di-GMP-specific phosphodiesterase class I)
VIDLAHSLNLTVVAEGVEDTETIWMLRDFGCDVAQGYHLSPPLPLTELLDLLHAGTINPASQSLRTV